MFDRFLATSLALATPTAVLTEQSVITTNAPVCVLRSDFEEIILDIERGGDGEAIYKTKPGCDSIAGGVTIQLVKKVDSYEFKGVQYWLLEARVYNTNLVLYVGLPARLFFNPKDYV